MMNGRTASSSNTTASPLWPGRSHVTTYIHCLHLLDLDQLEDWPGIDEQMFSVKTAQQHLQQRVKASEWSLYRLAELYDPVETRDKLRPFFPPVTQLQSLNLRAALYRYLSELKKNGVLGKDVVLRKTMLDDCKGDRFEELLSNFAMTTLFKVTSRTASKLHARLQDRQLVPIILAYRASLGRSLETRKEADESMEQKLELLSTAGTVLQERLEASKSTSISLDVKRQTEVRSVLNNNWIGDNRWTDVLLTGPSSKSVLNRVDSNGQIGLSTDSQRLLGNLDRRVKERQSKLAEWKVIARDLSSQVMQKYPEVKTEAEPTLHSNKTPRFSRHKMLNVVERIAKPSQETPVVEAYQRLLTAMKQELSGPPVDTAKASVDVLHPQHDLSLPEVETLPSPPRSAAPPVEEQSLPSVRGVDVRNSPDSHIQQNEITRKPPSFQRSISPSFQRSISPSPTRSENNDDSWIPQQVSTTATQPYNPSMPIQTQTSSPHLSGQPDSPISPSKLWMSLADRTRASMSLTGRQSILSDLETSASQEAEQTSNTTLPDLHPSSDDDSHATLLERTRKSMSMFGAGIGPRPRKPRTEQRSSQSFPVNQFETPSRSRRSMEPIPSSGTSTPRDQLFDEEAEYASIFKSRPKLASSPALSPERRSAVLDSILERDMERLGLDDGEPD